MSMYTPSSCHTPAGMGRQAAIPAARSPIPSRMYGRLVDSWPFVASRLSDDEASAVI
jgi:hypothetical protein